MEKAIEFVIESPLVIVGVGDSLWGNSEGTFRPTRGSITYINWVACSNNKKYQLFVSVNLFGKELNSDQFTDTGIEADLNQSTGLKTQLISVVRAAITTAEFNDEVSEDVDIGWSEHGLQPDNGWNFDVTFGKKKSL